MDFPISEYLSEQEATVVSVIICTLINWVVVVPVAYLMLYLSIEDVPKGRRIERTIDHKVDGKTKAKRAIATIVGLLDIGIFTFLSFWLTIDLPMGDSNKFVLWALPSFVNEVFFVQVGKAIFQFWVIKTLQSDSLKSQKSLRSILLKIANPAVLKVFKE